MKPTYSTPINFPFSGGNAYSENVQISYNKRLFQAVRYHGKFKIESLQGKADSRLFFCRPLATFCAYVQQGEGETPELAFADMQARVKETLERAALIHGL